MQRRKFIQSAAIASTIPFSFATGDNSIDGTNFELEKELYEIRAYEIKFRGNANTLIEYLKNVLAPALMRKGANHFYLMEEMGNSDPRVIRALISYPSSKVYINCQNLQSDADYAKAAKPYHQLPIEKTIFSRMSSYLLNAFDGYPKLSNPVDEASVFELRIYEGYNEDAVRRKIKMFNVEEIELFKKVGLHPLFFGEMIVGPYLPCLVYMLNFKDMEERDANWKKFLEHPDWNNMKAKEEYANTVSNIRKVFLKSIM